MKILGISSAGEVLGVAVVEGGVVLGEITLKAKQSGSEEIVPLLEFMLAKAGITIEQIEKIGVISGPGSYSGLRGGVAVAKSLAQVNQLALAGISALKAIACNFRGISGTLLVLAHACRDEFNAALFGIEKNKINRLTADFTIKEDKIQVFLNKIKGEIYLSTDRNINSADSGIVPGNPEQAFPYARNAAFLAEFKAAEDYLSLVPGYSHQPDIKPWKSR